MQKTATIFGGTGFIGRQIVKRLASAGVQVRVACRAPESAYELKPLGDVGQITAVAFRAGDYDSIAQAVQDADYVVNCIGILHETSHASFMGVHADLAESIATAAAIGGVDRLVHISALGADVAQSQYAKSKLEGERRVFKSFPNATILRPSIVFGADDNFFNRFAKLAGCLPFLPLIGGGHTKFQPVYVGDVAAAAMEALTASALGSDAPLGQIYELGGSEVLTFKQLFEKMFQYTGAPKRLLSIPFWVAEMQASILGVLPNPMLTGDQVASLKTDNVVSEGAKSLADFGIDPVLLDVVLPTYLNRYRAGGRFAI